MARQSPAALVLGTRRRRIAGCLWRSRFGRRFSNAMVWLESGLSVADSQCGLRVYPLKLVNSIRCSASRYGYETEILTKAAWSGMPVVQTPVNCNYSQDARELSHFKPLADSLRALGMHARLLGPAMLGWPRRLAMACNPVAVFRHLRTTPAACNGFAAGVGLGVFFACTPLYGIQGILSFVVAGLLGINRISALAASHISMPPLGAILIAASVTAGHLLLHGTLPDLAALHAAHQSIWSLATLRTVLLDWIVGGMLVGTVLGIVAYLATGSSPRWRSAAMSAGIAAMVAARSRWMACR
jgi:uncharacterized protein (DUF2062 family)